MDSPSKDFGDAAEGFGVHCRDLSGLWGRGGLSRHRAASPWLVGSHYWDFWDPSMRFWQWRGEFVPAHNLNLWLSFLFVSLPLLMTPKGKFLLQ